MTRFMRQLNNDTAVPQVTCPMCKADMRVATAEPVQLLALKPRPRLLFRARRRMLTNV